MAKIQTINKASGSRFTCLMDDGSEWSCDSDGTDWKQEKPSIVALQKSFDDFSSASGNYKLKKK